MPPFASDTPIHSSPAPQRGGDQRGDDVAGLPGRVGELLELAHVAEHFADLVAGHAGAVVHGGQDEQGFEHDGEVVPEGHRVVAAQVGLEEVGHAHGERGGATGAGDDGGLADVQRPVQGEAHGGCRHGTDHHQAEDGCTAGRNAHQAAVKDGVDEACAQCVAQFQQDPFEQGLRNAIQQDEDKGAEDVALRSTDRLQYRHR